MSGRTPYTSGDGVICHIKKNQHNTNWLKYSTVNNIYTILDTQGKRLSCYHKAWCHLICDNSVFV